MKDKKTFRFFNVNEQLTLVIDKKSLFLYTNKGTKEYPYENFGLFDWSDYHHCYRTYYGGSQSNFLLIFFAKTTLLAKGNSYSCYLDMGDCDPYMLKNLDTRLKFVKAMKELTNNLIK